MGFTHFKFQVALSLHYTTQSTSNPRAFLAQLAQKRGLVKKGGIPDCDAAARQILQDCQRGKFSFYTKAPNVKVLEVPEYLEPKLVTEMSAEFQLDQADDWMETTELVAPSSGAAIGMRNDGLTEIEEFEDDSDMEEVSEGEEMEEDDRDTEEDAEGNSTQFS